MGRALSAGNGGKSGSSAPDPSQGAGSGCSCGPRCPGWPSPRRPSIVTWDWPGSSVGLTRGSGWCRQTRNCTEIDRSGTMYKIVRRVYRFELFFLQPVVARASPRRSVRRECPLQAKREDTLNKESTTVMIA